MFMHVYTNIRDGKIIVGKYYKHCSKGKKYSIGAISTFITMFSNTVCYSTSQNTSVRDHRIRAVLTINIYFVVKV